MANPLLYLVVALGIGLVIFVHEAGHFIAARLCKVRVDVFSLGFGPRLFGFKRGSTQYQVAAVPLGGYVKMAGEDPFEERPLYGSGDGEDGLLSEKSVAQRFFIYSGGVLMNVVFGLIVFPIVFTVGVPFIEPVIEAQPGTPAWHAGIESGSRVLAINGTEVLDFSHLAGEVAYGGKSDAVLTVMAPGASQAHDITLKPEYHDGNGLYAIGVSPPTDRLVVQRGSAAEDAGLESEDVLLGVVGANPILSPREQLFQALFSSAPMELRVAREGVEREVRVVPRADENTLGPKYIGVAPGGLIIADLRPNALAGELGLMQDDRVMEVQGQVILEYEELLDALVLPADELRIVVERAGRTVELHHGSVSPETALALATDLFLQTDTDRTRVVVKEGGGAAAAGLISGDRILNVGGTSVDNWSAFQKLAQEAGREEGPVKVSVLRGRGETARALEFDVTPRHDPRFDYGILVAPARYTYRADSLGEAIQVGVSSSWRFLTDAAVAVGRLLTREVRSDNIGGIITIGVASHSFASEGLSKLFYFLCLLSMNLAFVNVLPIPVLDGGHLFFLLIEAVKGSPVSERTLGYSQVVGLVLIVSLMVYVTYNDVARWIFPS